MCIPVGCPTKLFVYRIILPCEPTHYRHYDNTGLTTDTHKAFKLLVMGAVNALLHVVLPWPLIGQQQIPSLDCVSAAKLDHRSDLRLHCSLLGHSVSVRTIAMYSPLSSNQAINEWACRHHGIWACRHHSTYADCGTCGMSLHILLDAHILCLVWF